MKASQTVSLILLLFVLACPTNGQLYTNGIVAYQTFQNETYTNDFENFTFTYLTYLSVE